MSKPLLERIKSEIQYDRLTVSFSIEGRDTNGVKKYSSFTAGVSSSGAPWSPVEMPIVRALVSKQVVTATYQDALQRGAISKEIYKRELTTILKTTDDHITSLLSKVEPGEDHGD